MEKEEIEYLNKLADMIKQRGLEVPTILLGETIKPVSFLMSQMLVFFRPFVTVFVAPEYYDKFVSLLEDRKKLEYLLKLIETKEEDT